MRDFLLAFTAPDTLPSLYVAIFVVLVDIAFTILRRVRSLPYKRFPAFETHLFILFSPVLMGGLMNFGLGLHTEGVMLLVATYIIGGLTVLWVVPYLLVRLGIYLMRGDQRMLGT